jgi:hypothetical protein
MNARSWLTISLLAIAGIGAIGSLYQPAIETSPPPEAVTTTTPSVPASTTTTTTTTTILTGSPSTGCLTGEDHTPTGKLVLVPGSSQATDVEPLTRYLIEVEEGLGIDPTCFADEVVRVLSDSRSWAGDGSLSLQRVDSGLVDIRVTIASPATTDSYCLPMETNGIYSCWNGERAMINVWRWEHATDEFDGDLLEYRTYVINHEVGHGLGRNHRLCPGEGSPAPVMQQQTIALNGCAPNGWPLEVERS